MIGSVAQAAMLGRGFGERKGAVRKREREQRWREFLFLIGERRVNGGRGFENFQWQFCFLILI